MGKPAGGPVSNRRPRDVRIMRDHGAARIGGASNSICNHGPVVQESKAIFDRQGGLESGVASYPSRGPLQRGRERYMGVLLYRITLMEPSYESLVGAVSKLVMQSAMGRHPGHPEIEAIGHVICDGSPPGHLEIEAI